MNFSERYNKLNTSQKAAVEHIDGPLMVVAGPGTGKTELLSMRTANILKKTDVLPENILCLTFTESGSIAMQKRLSDIIGRDAYSVSIYTFHAFGSEIISRYREYFYNGAQFSPADELNQLQIINQILASLEHDNPLKSVMNGEFTYTSAIKSAISDIKRSGLTADELTAILDANDEVITYTEPILQEVFTDRVSKSTFENLAKAAEAIASINEPQPIPSIPRLSGVLKLSLKNAVEKASQHPKITPPITEWKKSWLAFNAKKELVLKTTNQQAKLRALVQVYDLYTKIMQEAELFDFDDMIAQVVQAIETKPELRYELQEKYQYIMVDEFQDTNLAQMRILKNLTDNPANEGNPNIMVVGDDDQAIYGFQGADVGNILQFRSNYPSAKLITLTENYRSAETILSAARDVIAQGEERLERHIEELDKTLSPNASSENSKSALVMLPTQSAERSWIIESVKKQIENGESPSDIAILARRHIDLEKLLPYFAKSNIPISYEKRDNVLEDEVVQQLESVANIIIAIAEQRLDESNQLISQTFSHPAWKIPPETLWEISLKSYKNKTLWLETMKANPKTSSIANWLTTCASVSTYTPLERMLDILIGEDTVSQSEDEKESYRSPLKEHFFGNEPESYITHLANLTAIRNKLREHSLDTAKPRLTDFLTFIQQCRDSNTSITSLRKIGDEATSVRLMSAHASKGLEFDTVYLMNAVDSNWGSKASGGSPKISYPENLRLRQNNNSQEERLRLFFVGMTRAKRQLFVSYSQDSDSSKELLLTNFLVDNSQLTQESPNIEVSNLETDTIENEWYAPIINLPVTSMRQQLANTLDHYKLSATHINNFIDIPNGGPQFFLLNNLLHFPSARSPYAGYGNAIHIALQQAHDYLKAHNQPQAEEDILRSFEQALTKEQLSSEEYDNFYAKGIEALRIFLKEKHNTFNTNQQAELNFINQQSRLNSAHLTGKLDVADIDIKLKTIAVTDYKTGSALSDWGKGADYQKIKSHKYRQQLLFYKLLIENSRDFRDYKFTGGTLQFVEPNKAGEIVSLELNDITEEEVTNFSKLIEAIWQHIQDLSFPDTSQYEENYKGIQKFEEDLINGVI